MIRRPPVLVACFRRLCRFLGRSQHSGQIPSQLDPQLIAPRGQDDRFDKASDYLGGFRAGVLASKRGCQLLHLRPVVTSPPENDDS